MKNIKRILVALVAVLVSVGCGNSKPAENTDIVSEITEETEVIFWHAMNGAQEEALVSITNKFMDKYPLIKVTLQNQSKYPELQSKLLATSISPTDLPTMTQAYPGWLYNMTVDKLVVDLKPYIEHSTIGMTDYDDINEGFRNGAIIDGVTYGMPFNKSTEVLYYNKTILDKLGLDAPTTFEELTAVSKEIFEKEGIVGVGFDSLNNYYATGMANKGVSFNEDLDATSKESLEVANYYREGVEAGYFRTADSGEYLSTPFGNGILAMNVGSTAGESHIIKGAVNGGFEVGAVLRPEPKNIQQGTDLYMFESASAEQKTAAFEYMKFLVSKESQIEWAVKTGYIPVRTSAMEDEEYTTSGSMISPIMADAMKDTYTIPVSANADAAYNSSRDFMELILNDLKVDLESAAKDFNDSLKATWAE